MGIEYFREGGIIPLNPSALNDNGVINQVGLERAEYDPPDGVSEPKVAVVVPSDCQYLDWFPIEGRRYSGADRFDENLAVTVFSLRPGVGCVARHDEDAILHPLADRINGPTDKGGPSKYRIFDRIFGEVNVT